MSATDRLQTGEVGFVHAGIKQIGDCRVGDTMTDASNPADPALPGYKTGQADGLLRPLPGRRRSVPGLARSARRLQLNDAALTFEPETSAALGFGFRCGFLGLLHNEIIQERLEREFNLELVATSPSVVYRVTLTDGTVQEIDNPAAGRTPDGSRRWKSPTSLATIIAPTAYVGTCMDLCTEAPRHLPPQRIQPAIA